MKIVCLEVTCWAACIGGEHYTGSLHFYSDKERRKYEKAELKHPLTAKEALALNKKGEAWHHYARWKPGDECGSFVTREQLVRHAKKQYKRVCPDADALIVGSFGVASVQRVLDGPKEFMVPANKLKDEMERIGGYEGNWDRAGEIDKEYWRLLKRFKTN